MTVYSAVSYIKLSSLPKVMEKGQCTFGMFFSPKFPLKRRKSNPLPRAQSLDESTIISIQFLYIAYINIYNKVLTWIILSYETKRQSSP